MYFALVKVFNVYVPSYILKFCALGWGESCDQPTDLSQAETREHLSQIIVLIIMSEDVTHAARSSSRASSDDLHPGADREQRGLWQSPLHRRSAQPGDT